MLNFAVGVKTPDNNHENTMPKIIIAIDSFKGSLTSEQAGAAAMSGVREAFSQWGKSQMPEVHVVPVGDGGEGTVRALSAGLGCSWRTVRVHGPLGEAVDARYGVSADGATAVMEMASASGLPLIAPERRNPLLTTTYGTGQMIADALEGGCTTLVLGIGGSATNDGGMGMLAALGARFTDAGGQIVEPCGGNLGKVAHADFGAMDPRLGACTIMVACDVGNPLCGPDGASAVFGPQKGADRAMVERLESGMENYAAVVAAATGRDDSRSFGAGAAGGLGFACVGVLGARMMPGIDLVLDLLKFDQLLEGADLVITGEGKLDRQTLMGKTPSGILQRAKSAGVAAVAVGGTLDTDATGELLQAGFRAVLPIVSGPCSLEHAMDADVATSNLARTCCQIARLFFRLSHPA